MIPFTASMLLGRPGRYPVHSFVIIEPPGLTFKRHDDKDSADGINISIPGTSTTMRPSISGGGSSGGREEEEESGCSSSSRKDISDAEWILLETLDVRSNRPLHTGPFLTVQRRRRRRKYVRSLFFKDPTLIDELSSHQTNLVLDRIGHWEFNAFILDNVTGGRPLPNLCVHLFKLYGLLEHFNLDPVVVWKVFSVIEDGYHWRNPYHNAVHAADVTQAMHCFLQEKKILEKATPIEILSALLAAVTHDLDHPGVNQPFLVATSNHLAALYKNSSVLENHHWRSAMGCLHESGMSDILGDEVVKEVEWRIRELVLATDITRQKEFLDRLKEYLDTDTLDMDSPEVRHFILQIALKCADICNPARPWPISRKWSMKVCEEFFRQGDYERQLNLNVTALCDRYSTSVPKIQTGFFDFVVQPLFTEWQRMMTTTLSTKMSENLSWNRNKWQQLLQDELQATRTEEDEPHQEIPKHCIEDSDINVSVAKIQVAAASRSVRFVDTTITVASDSEPSNDEDDDGEGEEELGSPQKPESEFLGIPRPDRRRHSIATGLMGIQVSPSQLLGLSPDISRMVGRTVIRRESLPSGSLRALPSKTILHLQRLSKDNTDSTDDGSNSPPPDLPSSPARHENKSSCSSTSTIDEMLDFTYSLPESSSSPRRSEAKDLDELCPPTSILSMSPSVAHVSLQQSIEVDEQRRHLIRQQTCPVVSVNAGENNFNRPRFLSAAAAISPTSSSIISRHRSPDISEEGGSGGSGGRLSGGSSNECCVISEDVQAEEASTPLEIFVQQPGEGDDGEEAPRRESGGSQGGLEIEDPELLCSQLSPRGCGAHGDSVSSDDEMEEDEARHDSGTQTDLADTFHRILFSRDEEEDFDPSMPSSHAAGFNSVATSTGNNRLATLLMWRNNRIWKSLTEEGPDGSTCCETDVEDEYFLGENPWGDVRFNQGVRLQARRGSAPTTGPASTLLSNRGAQDRRSDPTQYYSHNGGDYEVAFQLRRGSVPVELVRQSRTLPKKSNTRTARRGSLPTEASAGASFALKLPMQVFSYSEDDSAISIKRRSSGGPELFSAAEKLSWKTTPVLIERFGTCAMETASTSTFWPGRRRGSLPVEVRIASSVSCSSESESSAGDSSDTT